MNNNSYGTSKVHKTLEGMAALDPKISRKIGRTLSRACRMYSHISFDSIDADIGLAICHAFRWDQQYHINKLEVPERVRAHLLNAVSIEYKKRVKILREKQKK